MHSKKVIHLTFLEKLDALMAEQNLNKSTLSSASGIPYTTIDGFYKKGFENVKLSTIQKLAKYFDTTLDYFMREDVEDRNFGKPFTKSYDDLSERERAVALAYRTASTDDKAVVDAVLKKYLEQQQKYISELAI